MEYLSRTVGIHVKLKDRGAFRTEGSLIVGTARVALDVDDLAVDGADQGGAADRTVGTEASLNFSPE